jgi:hypothetical protein
MCVYGGGISREEWMKEIKVMVYGIWTSYNIWNRTKKSLSIALSGAGRELRGRDKGGNVTNVQYKSNQNCHYDYHLYNELYPSKKKL